MKREYKAAFTSVIVLKLRKAGAKVVGDGAGEGCIHQAILGRF